MFVTSPDLVAEYRRLLSQTEEMLALHNEKQWVGVLQRWRSELTSAIPDFDLRQHAVRTARALGGLESISHIALVIGIHSATECVLQAESPLNAPTAQNVAFTTLLDALYATCRQIRNSQTVAIEPPKR